MIPSLPLSTRTLPTSTTLHTFSLFLTALHTHCHTRTRYTYPPYCTTHARFAHHRHTPAAAYPTRAALHAHAQLPVPPACPHILPHVSATHAGRLHHPLRRAPVPLPASRAGWVGSFVPHMDAQRWTVTHYGTALPAHRTPPHTATCLPGNPGYARRWRTRTRMYGPCCCAARQHARQHIPARVCLVYRSAQTPGRTPRTSHACHRYQTLRYAWFPHAAPAWR